MSNIQPIYIYKFELEHINKYVLLDTINYNPEDEVFCIISFISLNARIYINKTINKSYFTISEDWQYWYKLNSVVSINKKTKRFHLMSFNSLIDLSEQCNKFEYYKLTNILQLIIAKWDGGLIKFEMPIINTINKLSFNKVLTYYDDLVRAVEYSKKPNAGLTYSTYVQHCKDYKHYYEKIVELMQLIIAKWDDWN